MDMPSGIGGGDRKDSAESDGARGFFGKLGARKARSRDGAATLANLDTREALLLQRLLVRRFGPLPNDRVIQISSATKEQLEHWSDRVLDADSLDDVFRS